MITHNIYIDDAREAPPGYKLVRKTSVAIAFIDALIEMQRKIGIIDIDHDAGDYAEYGGDYIKVLEHMEEKYGNKYRFKIHIHSMNSVGVANMRRIIKRNGWEEIKSVKTP